MPQFLIYQTQDDATILSRIKTNKQELRFVCRAEHVPAYESQIKELTAQIEKLSFENEKLNHMIDKIRSEKNELIDELDRCADETDDALASLSDERFNNRVLERVNHKLVYMLNNTLEDIAYTEIMNDERENIRD